MKNGALLASRTGLATIYFLLALVALSMVLPFVQILARSLSFPTEVATGSVTLWPRGLTSGNYAYLGNYPMLWRSFLNSVFVTAAGTAWSLLVTALMAYPLSRPKAEFTAGPGTILVVLFTMVFTAPLVPFYIVMRELNLLNGLFRSLVVTHTIQPFYLILMIVYFRDFEPELFDAARIDGANDVVILARIVVPLSMPIVATLAVYYAVSYWNIFQTALLLITDRNLKTLQVFIQELLNASAEESERPLGVYDPFASSDSVRAALTIVSIVPIVIVYPLLQRYFISGVKLGAIKG